MLDLKVDHTRTLNCSPNTRIETWSKEKRDWILTDKLTHKCVIGLVAILKRVVMLVLCSICRGNTAYRPLVRDKIVGVKELCSAYLH